MDLSGPDIFVDGNTLFLTQCRNDDPDSLSSRVLCHLGRSHYPRLENVLVDCADLRRIGVPLDTEFIHLDRVLNDHDIRLLLLDAPSECRQRLRVQLPNTIWIDSTAAGYFGQEMKAKTFSHQLKHATA